MPTPRANLLALGCAILAVGGVALLALREQPEDASPITTPVGPGAQPETGRAAPRESVSLESGNEVVINTPAELRTFKRRCDTATSPDEPWLRQLALQAEDPLVAGQAIQALGRLGLFGNDPAYLRLLDDPRTRVRHETVRALGGCGDASATAILTPLLAEPDDTTRALAIQALGRLPGRGARESLLTYERTADPSETELAFLRAALNPEPMRIGQRQGEGDTRSPVRDR